MLTECPSCQTRYEVADPLLRKRGRRIRCSQCNEGWYLPPPSSLKTIVAPELPALVAAQEAIAAAPPRVPVEVVLRRREVAPHHVMQPIEVPSRIVSSRVKAEKKPFLHWPVFTLSPGVLPACTGLACLALTMGAIGQRELIVRNMPRTAPLFSAIGLPVNLRGLEFRDFKSTLMTDNGNRTLAVEGVIAQVGRKDANVPDVRVAVTDPSGREIYSWTTPAPRETLTRGETVLFRARLASPPPAGSRIKVQFASAQKP